MQQWTGAIVEWVSNGFLGFWRPQRVSVVGNVFGGILESMGVRGF